MSELQAVIRRITCEEQQYWRVLKRGHALAEQMMTNGFRNTVIFEPWGGTFPITTAGAKHYGWTNSQPLDKIDGYDLLKVDGKQLLWNILDSHDPILTVIAFDCRIWSPLTRLSPNIDWDEWRRTTGRATLSLIRAICRQRIKQGRFFLIENPLGADSWHYGSYLQDVFDMDGVAFTSCHQCAYGAVDSESGDPIKKPTGWMSNSPAVLNELSRQCTCSRQHALVLGSNANGTRSSQAGRYPPDLARAVCHGLLQQIRIEAAIQLAGSGIQHFAFLGYSASRKQLFS